MLSVYTRHYPPCPQTDIYYRRCHCRKWIRGRLADEGVIRRTARTRNWSKAGTGTRTPLGVHWYVSTTPKRA